MIRLDSGIFSKIIGLILVLPITLFVFSILISQSWDIGLFILPIFALFVRITILIIKSKTNVFIDRDEKKIVLGGDIIKFEEIEMFAYGYYEAIIKTNNKLYYFTISSDVRKYFNNNNNILIQSFFGGFEKPGYCVKNLMNLNKNNVHEFNRLSLLVWILTRYFIDYDFNIGFRLIRL